MSNNAPSDRLQELLATLYSDIVRYAREDMMPAAEKNFHSIRDYALGDHVSCTAEAALENCEHLKNHFAADAPRSVMENVDAVEDEIKRLEQMRRPFFVGKLWIIIILAAIAFFVYFVKTYR